MQHARFTIATLDVDGADVPLLYADLVVVRHEGTEGLDWECVAASLPRDPYEKASHHLTMRVLEDQRVLRGDAVVVRSDDRRHVFRGVGALDGLRPSDGLDPAP